MGSGIDGTPSTDGNGNASWTNVQVMPYWLSGSLYQVSASYQGESAYSGFVIPWTGGSATLTFTGTIIPTTGHLLARVWDLTNQVNLSGATVTYQGLGSQTTNSNGIADFGQVTVGATLTGSAAKSGYSTDSHVATMSAGTFTDAFNLTFSPPPPASTYYVCTYTNPSSASYIIGGTTVHDGMRAVVVPNQTYAIQAIPPTGSTFTSWTSERGVHVASSTAGNTTVTFDSTGWDGTCVGNLTANYNLPPPPPQQKRTVSAHLTVTKGSPTPTVTFHLVVDGQTVDSVGVDAANVVLGQPIVEQWQVDAGHQVIVQVHVTNRKGSNNYSAPATT